MYVDVECVPLVFPPIRLILRLPPKSLTARFMHTSMIIEGLCVHKHTI